MLINVRLPLLATMIYDKMNLAGSINFNFPFTVPLSYVSDKSVFGHSPDNYKIHGIECSSFIYNLQSQVVVYLLLILLSKVSLSLLSKCEDKDGRGFRVIKMLLRPLATLTSIIPEMYFQQRMMFYMYFFHFLLHRFDYLHLAYQVPFFTTFADLIAMMVFLMADSCFIYKYCSFIRDNTILRTKRIGFISMHSEFDPFKEPIRSKVVMLVDILAMQMLIPMIIVSQVSELVKCGVTAAMCVVNLLLLLISVGIATNKRQLLCYVANYFCVGVFCIIWLIGSMVCSDFVHSVEFGATMSVLIGIPTVVTMVCYLPQNIREVKNAIVKLMKKCRRKRK